MDMLAGMAAQEAARAKAQADDAQAARHALEAKAIADNKELDESLGQPTLLIRDTLSEVDVDLAIEQLLEMKGKASKAMLDLLQQELAVHEGISEAVARLEHILSSQHTGSAQIIQIDTDGMKSRANQLFTLKFMELICQQVKLPEHIQAVALTASAERFFGTPPLAPQAKPQDITKRDLGMVTAALERQSEQIGRLNTQAVASPKKSAAPMFTANPFKA